MMCTQLASIGCCFLLVALSCQGINTFAQNSSAADSQRISEIKAKVAKFDTNKKRIVVKYNDRRKLIGTVQSVGNDSFVLREKDTGGATTVSYTDVKSINGYSPATKYIIIGAVGAGAAILIGLLNSRCRNEGNNTLCL
ncbi:MAG: hypothetical protein NVSMB56_20570 [Pyrinomonadaceae bacterium]